MSWKLLFLLIACFLIVLLLSYAFNPKVLLSPRGEDDVNLFCGICSPVSCWHSPTNETRSCAVGKNCVDQGWCYEGWHNAGRRCKCEAPGEGVSGIKFADE